MATRSLAKPRMSDAAVVASVLSARNIDGVAYRAGQLVRMEAERAKPYVDDGTFDANIEAVAYRKGLGEDIVDHIPASEVEAEKQGGSEAESE